MVRLLSEVERRVPPLAGPMDSQGLAMSASSEGSGRRPTQTEPHAQGPASGSLRRRNPREGVLRRSSALYGDCDLPQVIVVVVVQAAKGSTAIQQSTDLARQSGDRQHDVETA